MTKQPQVEPVAQVVSMREIITGFGVTKHVEIAALRAEGLELGAELYTHADPGEVERLRERHEAWTAGVEQGKQESQSELSQLREDFDIAKNEDLKWQGLREQEAEIKALRTQLAEAHTLLREAACHATRMEPMTASCLNRIDAHLDASTAPSAPAEQNARKKKIQLSQHHEL